MKSISFLFPAAAALALAGCSQSPTAPAGPADIIPIPAEFSEEAGSWTPSGNVTLAITGLASDDSARVAARINSALPRAAVAADAADADIVLEKVTEVEGISSPEGYTLTVTPEGVKAQATDANGLFYSAVTLGEMLDAGSGSAKASTITDTPRLQYRGMMLDVSRNFRDTAFIRKQIDAMARLKLNNLHLHLTDAAGWRMEIKKYPRLTEFAAWRVGETWKDWNAAGNKYVEHTDSAASGGFYTQDELRDLVAYAADRYINIVPEIEMPGHSEEVMASYPELSCTHEQYGQADFCPGNEATFEFIENVLDEVMEVFPSKMIHIGGDEAGKSKWHTCALCAARMRTEKLKNVDELQSYLIHRVERYLNEKGRDMLGWDEIMEGGLAPNATVMSWRGTEGGERAAADGHRVIMTPGRYCYLDGYQDAPGTQPEAIGGYLPLELAYSYDPAGGMAEEAIPYVYGLQGNLFTEYVPTAEHAEYMLYPRMYAIAERAWSPRDVNDAADFRRRAVMLSRDMRADGYNTFNLETETGNRPEAKEADEHMARNAKVEYVSKPWANYPANGEATLVDGNHGGWNYNDERWQAFFNMDVVVDLGEEKDIHSVGADFMQICGPGVFMPAQVVISAGTDRDALTELATINHEVVRDDAVSFKNFGWEGNAKARYIRYQAKADSVIGGVLFTDEIVVK